MHTDFYNVYNNMPRSPHVAELWGPVTPTSDFDGFRVWTPCPAGLPQCWLWTQLELGVQSMVQADGATLLVGKMNHIPGPLSPNFC